MKGKQREQKEFSKKLFVGLTQVEILAINPTKQELNKLLEKDDQDDDKQIEYLGQDKDGNARTRLAFWLRDDKSEDLYVYSFNLIDKVRMNEAKDKVQVINATCGTTWVPIKADGEPDESLLPVWFKNYTKKVKDSKEVIVLGPKAWRVALSGEEELATLMRTWLGRADFMDPDNNVLLDIDTKEILKGNVKKLSALIDGDFDSAFVPLLGIKTDPDDKEKKYQQVYGKSFLPKGFMQYINNGLKFPSDYSKKIWDNFEKEVRGEYGFKCFFDLVPLKEYDPAEDVAAGDESKITEKTGSDY